MKQLKWIIPMAIAAIVLGVTVATLVNPAARLPRAWQRAVKQPLKVTLPGMKQVALAQEGDPEKRWQLFANKATLSQDGNRLLLSKVRVFFFPERGGKIVLEGNHGVYYTKKKIVTVSGNVWAQTHDGMTLHTNSITYLQKKEIVRTDELVKLSGPRFNLVSKGMRFYIPAQHVVFESKTRSTFQPVGSGPPPGVTAD